MISIIIPTHNEAAAIAKQLQNFREHLTAVPYELIVSDDNSNDDTVAKASPYADTIVSNPGTIRGTIAANRNRGAQAAKFEILVFIDAGIEIPNLNDFFKKILNRFDEIPNLVGITVNQRILPAVETFADKIILILFDGWIRLSNNLFRSGNSVGKFQMVKTSAFQKIGGYNTALAASEDFDLFHRLAKIGRTYFDSSLTIYHAGRRIHKVGWIKLLPLWILNGVWVILFKHSFSGDWKPMR